MLAAAVLPVFAARGHEVRGCSRAELDVLDGDVVRRAVRDFSPHVVVQCAAYTGVDDAEREREQAFALNGEAARIVGEAAAEVGARFVYPSTDYVFDGTASRPYQPSDPTSPINAYGESKLAGERATLGLVGGVVVRTSWLYGAGGKNFVSFVLARAAAGQPLRIVDDQHGCPTWTVTVAEAIAGLLENNAPDGVYHAVSRGITTWYGLAEAVVELAQLEAEVQPITTADLPRPARRPSYSALDVSRTEAVVGPLPHWHESLTRALPSLRP